MSSGPCIKHQYLSYSSLWGDHLLFNSSLWSSNYGAWSEFRTAITGKREVANCFSSKCQRDAIRLRRSEHFIISQSWEGSINGCKWLLFWEYSFPKKTITIAYWYKVIFFSPLEMLRTLDWIFLFYSLDILVIQPIFLKRSQWESKFLLF